TLLGKAGSPTGRGLPPWLSAATPAHREPAPETGFGVQSFRVVRDRSPTTDAQMIRTLLPAGLLFASSAALAQTSAKPLPLKLDPQKTTPAITTADLMTRIYRFAADSMRGRMAGSPEAMKGTEYIAS